METMALLLKPGAVGEMAQFIGDMIGHGLERFQA
jgi:hypothetical protein